LEDGLAKAGSIILITGAGGAFGAVLRETDLSSFAEQFAAIDGLGILIPFLIAAFLKTAQGSSTVAIITSAAICAPLVDSLGLNSTNGLALAVLAIGAGSLTVSHVNDSYFWVVSKFSEMDTSVALKTHTVATLIMGLTGLMTIQILAWVLL
jgi:GntP family gluconate:H+ symporter